MTTTSTDRYSSVISMLGVIVSLGCGAAPTPAPTPAAAPVPATAPVSVPLETLNHFSVVSVRINDTIDTRMIFDTGAGLTVLSKELCERAGCQLGGEHAGQRMSGQWITAPLGRITALTVAGARDTDVTIGVMDLAGMLPPGIDGILSLGPFAGRPFTIDRGARNLIVENAASLAQRRAAGATVPIEVAKDGPSITLFMSMAVPNGPPARVEIDTGSYSFILDERYLSRLGVDPAGPAVKRDRGTDETGNEYIRTFSDISGAIHPVGAPQMKLENPHVMFQKIIYDGLIGVSFLSGFDVTFDLAASQMILAPPQRSMKPAQKSTSI